MSPHHWTLSPSDFSSLWEECQRCFYLGIARGFPRPAAARIELEARVKAACDGRRAETIAPDMPAGVFEVGELQVDSDVIDVHLPDAILRCVIRGTLDVAVRLDDGGIALVDLVSSAERAEEYAARVRRLQACAYALEHAASRAHVLGPVARLGVLTFVPEKLAGEAGALTFGLSWTEVPRDDGRVFGFLAEALALLERPQPPGGTPLCPWCVYRDVSRRTGL